MRSGHPNSSALLNWNSIAAPCLLVLCATIAGCSDPVEQARERGAAAAQALENGNLEVAREQIRQALAARDDLPELFLLKGRIELAGGSEKGAYAAYASALSLDTANTEALQAISQLGLRTGNLRDSLDATEQLLVLNPNDPAALVARGVHSFLQRRFQEAIGYSDRVLANQPGDEAATILKSRSLFMEGKPTDALAVVNSLSAVTPPTPAIYRTRLELYREMREPSRMQEQFDKLRQLAPEDFSLRIDQSDLYYKTGNRSEGRAEIAKVLASHRLDGDTAHSATEVLNSYEDMLTVGEVATAAQSGSEPARTELARFLVSAGRPALAEIVLARLSSEDARPLRAQVVLLRKDTATALSIAQDVLKSDETNCDALIAAAGALLSQGRSAAALRNAQRAAAECPNRAEPWVITARVYAGRGEPVNAERAYRDAIASNPQSLKLTMAFGDWLVSQGRRSEAQAIARLLTRKSPALIRGWVYYRSLCAVTASGCALDADRGLADARTLYGPDPDVGKLAPGGLFGRLVRR
jgi:tetratricopeptide (TPR) repeat protein